MLLSAILLMTTRPDGRSGEGYGFALRGCTRISFPDRPCGIGLGVGGFLPFQKNEIEQVLENLLRSKELVIERAEVVFQALRKFSASRADFADCLIERCGHAAECQYTVTFDRNAAGATGMKLFG